MTTLSLHTTIGKRGPAAAIVLTDDQAAELGPARAAPVTVTIGATTRQLRLARMGGENLIGLSKAARAELGVDAGDEVDVVIRLDTAERTVDVPPALAAASPRTRVAPRRSRSCHTAGARRWRARSTTPSRRRPGNADSTRCWLSCTETDLRRGCRIGGCWA